LIDVVRDTVDFYSNLTSFSIAYPHIHTLMLFVFFVFFIK